jgi:DNA uptake protein ComE-like DNA-binding protein
MQLTLCVLVILSIFRAGMAQNQDRDLYKPSKTSANAPATEARIDINHATVDDLLKVPGLTRPWATRIVRFRSYRTKADLLEKGILSGEVYDRIKDFVIAHREKQ